MASFISRLSASGYEMVFRALARRRPPQARPIQLGARSRVLCFTCAGIGDTLTDSVVFKALRETYPEIHLAGVVHRRRHLLLEHNPHVDQVFLFHKGPVAFRDLLKELRAAGPWDAILQLRGNDPEPRCLSYLLDPDVTVSTPDMTRLSWLCGHQVVQPDWHDTHGVEQTLRLARYVGADTKEPVERFTKEIAPLVTCGSQGVTGYATGRPKVLPIFGYWPCLIPKSSVTPISKPQNDHG